MKVPVSCGPCYQLIPKKLTSQILFLICYTIVPAFLVLAVHGPISLFASKMEHFWPYAYMP